MFVTKRLRCVSKRLVSKRLCIETTGYPSVIIFIWLRPCHHFLFNLQFMQQDYVIFLGSSGYSFFFSGHHRRRFAVQVLLSLDEILFHLYHVRRENIEFWAEFCYLNTHFIELILFTTAQAYYGRSCDCGLKRAHNRRLQIIS